MSHENSTPALSVVTTVEIACQSFDLPAGLRLVIHTGGGSAHFTSDTWENVDVELENFSPATLRDLSGQLADIAAALSAALLKRKAG